MRPDRNARVAWRVERVRQGSVRPCVRGVSGERPSERSGIDVSIPSVPASTDSDSRSDVSSAQGLNPFCLR